MCYCCNVCHFMSTNFHRSVCDLELCHLTAEMLHIVEITIIICYILVSSEYWCVDSLSLRSSAETCRRCCCVYQMCICWFYK